MRFFKQNITSKQYTPHPNKRFFQNYDDHVKLFLVENLGRVDLDQYECFNAYDRARVFLLVNLCKIDREKYTLSNLTQFMIDHATMFDALCDQYDYFDEVIGSTLITALSFGVTGIILGAFMAEAIHALAIHFGACKDDHINHIDRMKIKLNIAAIVFILGTLNFMNSFISLFTRPLMTAIQGFKPQDKFRFYDEESVQNNPEVCAEQVKTYVSNLFSADKSQTTIRPPKLPVIPSWHIFYFTIAHLILSLALDPVASAPEPIEQRRHRLNR